MPEPLATRRIFISTVSNEFVTCRERLATDLRFPNVDIQTQEQNITLLAAGQTILLKLDDYIAQCHAVIHLIGQQTSKDGRPASKDAVDDLLQRYPDLPGVVQLSETELRTLSYTQWEAWLAYYHRKTKRPELQLMIATPKATFVPDHPADPATAHAQKLSQAWHEKELQQRGRWSEISFDDARDLSIAVLRALKEILPSPQPQQRIAPTRLISRHATDELLGREKELALLDGAWADPGVNLLSIIAWGGVGKTALLAYWVQDRFVKKGWKNDAGQPDPLAYFDWTFYDQGTRRDDATHAGAASVGTFFQTALKHFGDPEPDNPQNKVARLAERIHAQRTLLILDGLEPLQYPLNHPQAGQITDPDLRELLGLLAQRNPGLCVISSRQILIDFFRSESGSTQQYDLEDLPLECAVALLQKMQINGSVDDLREAAKDYFCHALSLIVLGRFLFVRGRDIRIRKQIKLERACENRNQSITRNAWHALEAYEQWLASPEGKAADVQALRLTGLFDRPAGADCLDALRSAPAIPGLTDALVVLDDDAWNGVLLRLHEAHLIQLRFPYVESTSFATRPEPREVPLDAHPLIREYFSKRLRELLPASFREAHSRLFDHLCRTTAYRPDDLEGLQPLYQAVIHGCLADRQQEAKENVYCDRILRGIGSDGFYSARRIGAIGANLGAVSAFFSEPWRRLSQNLSAGDQAWLLNDAGFGLRAIGRLTEAIEPMRGGLEIRIKQGVWKSAAIIASNLSELEVILGRLRDSVESARRSITFADTSEDTFQRIVSLATAGDALHQSGTPADRLEAHTRFEQSERIQQEFEPEYGRLYSLRGFQYCDLLLAPAERAVWQKLLFGAKKRLPRRGSIGDPHSALVDAEFRASTVMKWRAGAAWNPSADSLLGIALDYLTLSRVKLYRTIIESLRTRSYMSLDVPAVVDGLTKAGTTHMLPLALLTAGLHYHVLRDPAAVRRHLDEAQRIAERGPMPLYLADVHLHRARLVGSVKLDGGTRKGYEGIDPHAELAKARALIEKHGYGRRREELADAEAAAAHW